MNKKENNVGARLRPCPDNRGITLIALVITIIVMLILVGVTISMSVNGGLFEKAGEATGKTKNAIEEEQGLVDDVTDLIDYYTKKKAAVAGLKEYSEELLNDDGVLEENTKYEEGRNIAVIPKGFYLTNVEDEINKGIVIEDEAGNQFVWVPVEEGEFERTGWWANEPTDKTIDEITENWEEEDYKGYIATSYGYDSIDKMIEGLGYTDYEEMLDSEWGGTTLESTIDWFKDCYWWAGALSEDDYTESASNDPTGEYNKMVASVKKYGGFYIGRYEAGSNENRYETREDETVLVQKGAYPYNYVMWGLEMDEYEEESDDYGHGAVYLSRNMYTNKDAYGVTSTLCYGVQWNAALRFIRDKVDVTNSTNWGNYANHEFEFTGEYSADDAKTWDDDETEKTEDESWLLTTGASEANKAKNIYDLAGNVDEWTMEADSSTYPVFRGGSYNYNGGYNPASYRNYNIPSNFSNHLGFRPSLYIK